MGVTLRGLDVSYAQPGFDWTQAAREGVQFGICKRSEGTAGVDPEFDHHWGAIAQAGLGRGAYSFSRWDLDTDPTAEARWFLETLPPLAAGDVVALDIEASPIGIPGRPLSSWALAWLALVEHALGQRPLLYSGAWFAAAYLTDPRLEPYGKWVAGYSPTLPHLAAPWALIAAWQHTSACTCAGTTVDEDYFFGTLDQFRAYGKPAAPPPAPPAPPPALPHYEVRVATHLRPKPQLDASPLGPLLPAGTYVAEVQPPVGQPMETPHWRYVRTSGDQRGWAYAPDLSVDPGHPGNPPRTRV